MLGVAPAPEYTFVVYVCPVGHYFKVGEFGYFLFHISIFMVATVIFQCLIYFQDGLSPISLLTEEEYHRAAPGGTGDIKTIGNYASVTHLAL